MSEEKKNIISSTRAIGILTENERQQRKRKETTYMWFTASILQISDFWLLTYKRSFRIFYLQPIYVFKNAYTQLELEKEKKK